MSPGSAERIAGGAGRRTHSDEYVPVLTETQMPASDDGVEDVFSGVAGSESSENAPDPLTFLADTEKRYCELLVSPVTVLEVALASSVVMVEQDDPAQYFTE